jgi:hypothetical protein
MYGERIRRAKERKKEKDKNMIINR